MIFASNVQAFAVWRDCGKAIEIGGMGGVVPQQLETTEISAVCQVYDIKLTPSLLRRIRHLDDAWRDERVQQLNKIGKGKGNGK